jgi:hypothetical protein
MSDPHTCTFDADGNLPAERIDFFKIWMTMFTFRPNAPSAPLSSQQNGFGILTQKTQQFLLVVHAVLVAF